VVNDGDQVGIVVQVPELRFDVAEVDVDRNGANLERREHALDVFGAVEQLEADVVAGADAEVGQRIGQPVGALVELTEQQPPGRRDDDLAVGHGVGDALEKVRQVEATHRANI